MTDDVRDELPDDLDPAGFVGPYQFPDNSRRRWPGVIYLVVAALCVIVYVVFPDSPIVNDGWLRRGRPCSPWSAIISITSGWRMHVDETEALVAAQQAVGFPSATRRRNRSGAGCAAGRRGGCCATRPRTRRPSVAWCSSTPSTARWSTVWSRPTRR